MFLEYTMNKIVNKFLLARDKFVPEMHLRKPGFIYNACASFNKIKERMQKFKETGHSRYIYQSELDKACFQHDTGHVDFKDLTRRAASEKILHDKALSIAKNPKYYVYKRVFASMICNFFVKKSSGDAAALAWSETLGKWNNSAVKNQNMSNKELAEELHKPIISKLKSKKVNSRFIDNIWAADLADIQLVSKFNKGICFLLCSTEVFSKYAWTILLKDKCFSKNIRWI